MREKKYIVFVILACLVLAGIIYADIRIEKSKSPKIELYQVDETLEAPIWEDSFVAEEKGPGDLRIIQISDPHYYGQSLTDGGILYQTVMARAAGRDALHIGEILDAFYEQMQTFAPDVLVVSGDMSMNGEKASHEEFASYLRRFEDIGIKVLVIPGNHDINSSFCNAIYDTGALATENVSPEEFEEIYKDYGYEEAIYRDDESLSYVADVGNDCWAIMFDASIYKDGIIKANGQLSTNTRHWAYDILEEAKEKGIRVFTVSHQNMLVHNENFVSEYTIMDGASLAMHLMDAGVPINLSGHMHSMHITNRKNQFYEVALGSISVWPNLYGQLDIRRDGEVSYSTHATSHKSNSYAYMWDSTMRTLGDRVMQLEFSEEDKEKMREFMVQMNVDYFSGRTMRKEDCANQEGYLLWNALASNSFFMEYIDSILEQKQNDFTYILPYKAFDSEMLEE